jgi:hypothetical protein
VDFQHAHVAGWDWVANSPVNRPHTGAIVVWNGPVAALGLSIFGHTAVALLSDVRNLRTLDQNWPTGAPVHEVLHSYVGVVGWWSPPSPVLDRA